MHAHRADQLPQWATTVTVACIPQESALDREGESEELVEMMTKILHDKSLTLARSAREDAHSVIEAVEQKLREVDVGETQEREFQEDFGELRRWVERLPHTIDLSGKVIRTSDHPIASRGSQDIYAGEWIGQEVALAYPRNQSRAGWERFQRQVEIWRTLRHPNILQLLGIASIGYFVYSVSPYMEFDHVTRFLKAQPDADRVLLLSEIASATEYLHMNGVIHGDLRGSNVLVSRDGHAYLGDLGSARVEEVPVTEAITYGSLRWLAPELVANSSYILTTRATDVWSFGMLSLEIFTDSVPFGHVSNEASIPFVIRDGPLPTRPEHANTRGLSDTMWDLMSQCWQRDPESRPSMSEIREVIQNIHPRRSSFQSSRPSISNTPRGSLHRPSFSSAAGVPGGAREPEHFSIALNSSVSSALSSGLFGNKSSQTKTTPNTLSVNNAIINNLCYPSSTDVSFSNGPRSEVDSISACLSPTSSIRTTGTMIFRTSAITTVHEDEEQQPQPNIASRSVANSGSMESSTRAQHNFTTNKDNTRSTTRDRPFPNARASSPEIDYVSLLPGTPNSGNPSFHPGEPQAKPSPLSRTRTLPTEKSSKMAAPQPTRSATLPINLPQSPNWEPVNPVVLGLMEISASDSECLLWLATDGTVSAGNMEGLISRVITDIEDPSRNESFRATFLTIYQLFATSERLFHILKRRFESSELDPVAGRSRYPILLFIESWLKKGFADEDLKCTSTINEFVLPLVDSGIISEKMEAKAKEIACLINDPVYVRLRQPINCTALRSEPAERPQGVTPNDLAAALTVVEGDRFKCITYWDYVNFTRRPFNVRRIEVFNSVHDLVKVWVQLTILESDFLQERMEMYEEWISTAKACRALNNFSTTSAIVIALMSPLVGALALTCESKAKSDLYALAKELTPTKGVYQNTLQKVATRNLIPWLDLHLSTLNSSFAHSDPIFSVDGHPLIDFNYCGEIAKQIDTLVQYSPPLTRNTTRPDVLAYVEYSLKSSRGDDVLRNAKERSARLAGEERVFDAQRKKMIGLGYPWSPPRRRK